MNDWPDEDTINLGNGRGRGRMANLVVPVTDQSGAVVELLITVPEAGARRIANMDHRLAEARGSFFQVIRESLITFIEREG